MGFICVIPAREKSKRFPYKLLAEINGEKVITKVVESCAKSLAEEVIVATDSMKIKKVVDEFAEKKKKEGKKWALKIKSEIVRGKDIKSGTDRVAKYIFEKRKIKSENKGYEKSDNAEGNSKDGENKVPEIIVNVQGDEALITPEIINKVAKALEEDEKADISTYGFVSEDKKEIENPNRVKIVVSQEGYALYFSRSPIPYSSKSYIIHTGIYAFRKNSLLKFSKLKPTQNEKTEKLEQLRALDNGMKIKIVIGRKKLIPVDTKEDLKEIMKIIKNKNSTKKK